MTARRARLLSGPGLPHRLADLPEPPQELYLHGELPRGPAVAVVGTRHPTSGGRRFGEELAYDLAQAGVAVFSGGAEGIDTTAHEGALRARGSTVVVAPAGFERPFPAKNRALFERVLEEGGAYVSLVSDETPADRPAFFARNACLAALAHVVVVVEADFRSGARNAAGWARSLGRALLVVPHSPWSKKGRGCLLELRRGAAFCEGVGDVLFELERLLLRPFPVRPREAIQTTLSLAGPLAVDESDAERVKAAIASGAEHLDQVCELTHLSAAAVQRQILTLALDGVLAPDPSGRLSLLVRPPRQG